MYFNFDFSMVLSQTYRGSKNSVWSRGALSTAATLIASGFEIKRVWMNSWKDIKPPSKFCLSPNIGLSPGSNLPRNLWVTLNRLRTGVGCFGSNICHWGLRETASCICGEENQTSHHIIYHCEALRAPNSLDDLVSPGPEGVCWLDRLVGFGWGLLLIRKKKDWRDGNEVSW